MPKCNEKQIVIIVYCAKNNIYASQKVMFKLGKMQKVSLNSLKKIVIQTALLFFFFSVKCSRSSKTGNGDKYLSYLHNKYMAYLDGYYIHFLTSPMLIEKLPVAT